MAILPAWLSGRDDRQLGLLYASQGRESATDRRARKEAERQQRQAAQRRAAHHRQAAAADRAGQAWEASNRRYR